MILLAYFYSVTVTVTVGIWETPYPTVVVMYPGSAEAPVNNDPLLKKVPDFCKTLAEETFTLGKIEGKQGILTAIEHGLPASNPVVIRFRVATEKGKTSD